MLLQTAAHTACSSGAGLLQTRQQRAAARRGTSRVAAAAPNTAPGSQTGPNPTVRPIPGTPESQVTQAVTAIETAWQQGVRRQSIELLLPLIGATDLDDWPGGIRQQFKAAAPLVESILKQLKAKEGLQGPLSVDIWDQGDAVGAWAGDNLAAVLFPTAATFKQLRALAERQPSPPGLLLIVNPQWETQGNLMNDFGYGSGKAAAESLIATFQPSYVLKQLRVTGDELRVLRAFPGKWQVHIVRRDGTNQLLATFDEPPSYGALEAALKQLPEAAVNKSIFDRLRDEAKWIQDSAQQNPGRKD